MAIIDVETDLRVGVVKVYDYPLDPEDELDLGDVFFLSMKLDAPGRMIVIESARGDRFAHHIDSGEVRQAP